MKIYISIPITGHNIKTQQLKADEIAKKLRDKGHEPVNPFDTIQPPNGLREDERYAFYMGEDLKKLLMCDAVLLCDGWHRSKGCRAEDSIAHIYHIRRYTNIRQIPNWKF